MITKVVRGTLLFGGPGKASASSIATTTLTCPTTGQPFEVTFEVPVSEGERVDSVAVAVSETAWPAPVASDEVAPIPESVASHGPTPVASETPADWRAGELTEWLKNSANQGREAAAKLVVAGTAAVGAYFAILKVVAGEQIPTGDRALAIAPAVGYLVSTVLATLALLPALVRVFHLDDFERFREHRLKRLSLGKATPRRGRSGHLRKVPCTRRRVALSTGSSAPGFGADGSPGDDTLHTSAASGRALPA